MVSTPFGDVRETWDLVLLADHVFFQEGPGLRKWQWTESGMKVLNGKNVLDDGRIDLSNTDRHISLDEFRGRYSHFAVEDGDIIVVSSGSIGKVGRINASHLPLMMNTSVIRFHPKDDDVVDRNYLHGFLRSHLFQSQAKSFAIGVAQLNFGPVHLKQMKMPLPSISEQRSIGTTLSRYDDLIENNTRRIAILEEMARAMYREWFVEFRFPGHENVKMVESEVGPIPEGWAVVDLNTLAEINARSVKRGHEPSEISYIDISSVAPGTIEKIEKLTWGDAPSRARRIVQHGDIIWSTVRPNRRSYCLVLNPEPDLIVSTGFAVVSSTVAPFGYLYYALTTDEFVGYLVNHATGAAYPAVNAKDFERARVLHPPSEVLERFQAVVEPKSELQQVLARKNDRLRASRDLLLPKLVSGEVALDTVAEEPAEATA